jgi:hypothetical protein
MKLTAVPGSLAVLVPGALAAVVPRADISTLAGPFTFVTTLSTPFPVISTANLALYYPKVHLALGRFTILIH